MGKASLLSTPEAKRSDAAPPVVRVRNFRKSYGKRLAVDGLDLELRTGEIYGLIGPDGSGKSSVMKAVSGVLSFDSGEVDVFGVRVDSEKAAERIKDRLGFMPQGLGLNLYPELSVEENIDFFARLRLVPEADLAERKERLLAMTRLASFRHRPMKNLSGGMKQKLGLVCTLIHQPQLVILDEPTTGVDPVSRRDFWAILTDLLREQGTTALVSTAYMDEASRFQQISLLFNGRVLAQGTPEEIVAMVPGTLVTLMAQPQVKALLQLKTVFQQAQALGPWLQVFVEGADTDSAKRQVQSALDGVEIGKLYASETDLENVFIALLRKQQVETRAVTAPVVAETSHPGREIVIEAHDLSRDFGPFRAVDNVNFAVRRGEIFGLLGANGAGKTTVIKMLTGIIKPSDGEGRVAGVDMRRAGTAIKERIGYMSQAFSLYRDLTVVENINLYAGIYGLHRSEIRSRAEWIIDMAGLGGHENDRPDSLPMGIRQRLALGCALIHHPQILFLDEPTSGVDSLGRLNFWEILFRLSREEGVAILVTTHYMSEAEHCDHLALMFAGKIVADAPPAEMKKQVEEEAGKLLKIAAEKPAVALQHLLLHGFPGVTLFGNQIHVLSQSPEQDRERITGSLAAAGLATRSIAPQPLSMEDVFVYRITQLEQKARTQSERKKEAAS